MRGGAAHDRHGCADGRSRPAHDCRRAQRRRDRLRELVALRAGARGHEHAGTAGVRLALPELAPQAGVLEAVEPALAADDRRDHERDVRGQLTAVVEERDRQPGGERRG